LARKRKGRAVDGVVLLDKPQGMTSNAALQKVRRLFGAQKAGHTGSLDPLATGVLPVCLGEATKFSRYLLDADKGYVTTAKLGDIRTTSDSEGETVLLRDVPDYQQEQIEGVLTQFRGPVSQVPTMYSALKYQGRPLYEYARQGITVERPARPITIYELSLLDQRKDELDLRVACSKGTYIRTLVEDIGQALGCGAHVSMLRRFQAGFFSLQDTVTLDQLEGLAPNLPLAELPEEEAQLSELFHRLDTFLRPIDCLIPEFTKIYLKNDDVSSILQGQAVKIPPSENIQLDHEALVALYDANKNRFIGVAEYQMNDLLQPRRLVSFHTD
jgi:tRNA pseudouridine55 synthase